MPQPVPGFDRRGIFQASPVYRPSRELAWMQVAQRPTGHWSGDVFTGLASAIGLGRQSAAREREEQKALNLQQQQLANQQAFAAEFFGTDPERARVLLENEPLRELFVQRRRQAQEAAQRTREEESAAELARIRTDALAQIPEIGPERAAAIERIAGDRGVDLILQSLRPEIDLQPAIDYLVSQGEDPEEARGGLAAGLTAEQMLDRLDAERREAQGGSDGWERGTGTLQNTQFRRLPDGSFEAQPIPGTEGAGGGGKPLTEAQAKSANAATAIALAMTDLLAPGQGGRPRFESLTNVGNRVVDRLLPGAVGLGEDYEIASRAASRAVEGLLRQASGAATPDQEVARYIRDLAPGLGDEPGTVRHKLEQLAILGELQGQLAQGIQFPKLIALVNERIAQGDALARFMPNTEPAPGAAASTSGMHARPAMPRTLADVARARGLM
ncbi:MAG: hypothetical protein OXH38_11895 [Chloroflexi bacterium]|nr:hypothetical protein [Chloroflexota bacterium]